jgi:hypothetical protein
VPKTGLYILPLLILIPKYSKNTGLYFGDPLTHLLPGLIFFCGMGLSVLVNMPSITSINYFVREMLLLGLWMVCAILGQKTHHEFFFKTIIVIGGILLLLTIIIILSKGYNAYMTNVAYSLVDELNSSVMLKSEMFSGSRWRFSWPNMNTNTAVLILLLIFFICLRTFYQLAGRYRSIVFIIMIASLYFIMISYSRQGILLFFVGTFLFAYFGLVRKNLIFIGLACVVIYFFFFDPYFSSRVLSLIDALFGTNYSSILIHNTSTRLHSIPESVSYILRYPIFGMGHDQFNYIFARGEHVHFLAYSMKYGLPQAVALYLFLFIMPLISGIKIVKTIDSEYEKNILILFCILCFILIIVTLVAPAFHATYIFTGYLSGLGFKVKKRLKVLEFKKRDVSIKTRHNF